uniref:Uncharacterized protein n=1 Tax=viral metagenome TaxID=1070528 RepID=A0A6C0B5Q8_9ZZZZ
MREGSTVNNPINAGLYKKLYPRFTLPNKVYIRYKNKLYLKKNGTLNFIKNFFNTKRPEDKNIKKVYSDNRAQLKKNWIKKWNLEIKAQTREQ